MFLLVLIKSPMRRFFLFSGRSIPVIREVGESECSADTLHKPKEEREMSDRENSESVNAIENGDHEMSRGRARFEAFHRANPEVWELFERFCLEMIEAGKSDASASFFL